MKISKITYAALLTAVFTISQAQQGKLGINTTNPQATIDMNIADINLSTNSKEGLLIPRLSRQRADIMGTSVEQGTMIYVNNLDGTASGRVANVTKVGFYHFDGTEWIGLDNQRSPYNVILTPSANNINIGESITLNVKSNIPSQFFYTSSGKGVLKKAVNTAAENISEFAVIGSEGNALNSAGTDYIYTPQVTGTQNLICYFFDSDNNLITKQITINVGGQVGDELIKINGNDNVENFSGYFELKLNGSGNTQYQFKIEKTTGSPWVYFEDTNAYGNFVFGQWYNYPNQSINFDMIKQTPGANTLQISVRKQGSSVVEAVKEFRTSRKLFLENMEIAPRSKTLTVNSQVELILSNPNNNSGQNENVYATSVNATINSNLPIEVEARNAGNVFQQKMILNENGLVPGSSTFGGKFDLSNAGTNNIVNGQPAYHYLFKPLQVGTYILRFDIGGTSGSGSMIENDKREITVVLNVVS